MIFLNLSQMWRKDFSTLKLKWTFQRRCTINFSILGLIHSIFVNYTLQIKPFKKKQIFWYFSVLCILVECYTDREPRHSTRFKRSRLKVNCKNFEKYFSTSISTNNKNLHFQAYNYCCNSATSKNIRKNDTLVTKCVEAVQRHHLRNKKDENIPPLTVRRNVSKKQARYQKFKGKYLWKNLDIF